MAKYLAYKLLNIFKGCRRTKFYQATKRSDFVIAALPPSGQEGITQMHNVVATFTPFKDLSCFSTAAQNRDSVVERGTEALI